MEDDDDYEYEYEDTPDEVEESTPMSTAAWSPSEPYRVLNCAQVISMQNKIIENVHTYLHTDQHVTRRLLMNYHWNEERLMNEFFALGLDELLKRSGAKALDSGAGTGKNEPCLVCGDDELTEANSLRNSCGHRFCKECWTGHVLVQIAEGKSRNLACMAHRCGSVVASELVYQLELPRAKFDQYERAMLDTYVDDNPCVKWCPGKPFCGHAIELNSSVSAKLDCECKCEELFCFSCGDASHCPVPCEWAVEWKKRWEMESETSIYIANQCKPCSSCRKVIQKGEGCNHVTCICGQSMCWLCGAATGRAHDWTSIQGHECPKFEQNANKAVVAVRAVIRPGGEAAGGLGAVRPLGIAANAVGHLVNSGVNLGVLAEVPPGAGRFAGVVGAAGAPGAAPATAGPARFNRNGLPIPAPTAEDIEATQDLQRFVHYVSRFNNHMDSYKKAKVLEPLMIHDEDYRLIGLRQLLRMRIFMAWTYVFAFYAFNAKNSQILKNSATHLAMSNGALHFQTIFENIQSSLQTALEKLSRFAEMKHDQLTDEIRAEVLKQSVVTHQLAINLWEYIAEDILVVGLASLLTPNMYFPIRCIANGLGVRRTIENLNRTDRTKPSLSSSSAFDSSSMSVEVIDLVSDDDDGGLVPSGDDECEVMEVPAPFKRDAQYNSKRFKV